MFYKLRSSVLSRMLLVLSLSCVMTVPAKAQRDNDEGLTLRANLLRWATLTPDVGVEWSPDGKWGLLANGTWTHWSWSDKSRHYALWETSLEVRRYLCEQKRVYVGAQAKIGQFNYKLSSTGKQGDIVGGGLTGGYKLPIGKRLALDFSVGVGYLCVSSLEKYNVASGVRVKDGKSGNGYWGLTNVGVTLCYDIFK